MFVARNWLEVILFGLRQTKAETLKRNQLSDIKKAFSAGAMGNFHFPDT
jgi:hypothetical protein